jgi:hypothetical protein
VDAAGDDGVGGDDGGGGVDDDVEREVFGARMIVA